MSEYTIYKDISERTGGDIYIGVVGPVRTGKSSFIKKFLEEVVLPNIENDYDAERTRDEMPQSGAGKTVMTTEPKFIPDTAVNIKLSDNASMKVKLIDCVGYVVPDAIGHTENGEARMVMTPWSDAPVPFTDAAETGTRKVISDHSTIGIAVTTDGSIGEIPRSSYIDAEERVISELLSRGKPFAIILNSADPQNEESIKLAYELEDKYGVPVALVNCLMLDREDIDHILGLVLEEFPVKELNVNLPKWTDALEDGHWLKRSLLDGIMDSARSVKKIKDLSAALEKIKLNPYVKDVKMLNLDMGTGKAYVEAELLPDLYYKIISELTGFEVESDGGLIRLLADLSSVKNEYDKISEALNNVNEKGYGIVIPGVEELKLEEPEIIKQPGGYGVRLKASAPSIHMIKADIETEINPIVGTEQQSEDLIKYLLSDFDDDPSKIWETNIFGRTLHELVSDGLNTKLDHMQEDARTKLSETLSRIINEGSGGLICIIL
ncbi:MAG: stage IV sporulation protein A [Ruminococcaceae bacterium]|nr:stage IV sporulation protein A [Oscillospiraceae bacterium]